MATWMSVNTLIMGDRSRERALHFTRQILGGEDGKENKGGSSVLTHSLPVYRHSPDVQLWYAACLSPDCRSARSSARDWTCSMAEPQPRAGRRWLTVVAVFPPEILR